MPYFYDLNLNQNREQDPSQVQISGASSTTDNGETPSGAANQKKDSLNTGSGFQNLDSYLKTNNAQQFGQQVLGKVDSDIQGAKQNQSDAANQFKSQVAETNKLPTNEQVNQAISNPTGANAKDFQTWESQSYSGPKNLAESQDAWNKYWSGTNKANTSAQLLGTEPGRFTLLDSYFGKPTYSFGQKSLDNLLVQQSGLGQQTKNLQNQAAELNTQGFNQAKDLQNVSSQRAGEVEQSRNNVRQAIGLDEQGNVITGDNAGAIGKQWQAIDQAVSAANAARANEIAAINRDVQTGKFTPDELSKLGVSAGQNIYNLNLADYLTPGGELNKEQIMTPEQRAYVQALSELAGITDTYASGSPQEKDASYLFNVDKLKQDVSATQAAYNKALKETPVVVSSRSGQTNTYPLSELERQIQATYDDIARGNDTNAGRAFLEFAVPAADKAKAQLAKDFQIDRIISSTVPDVKVKPKNVSRPSSVGVR